VTAFVDPSAQFGFQFQPIEAAAEEDAAPQAPAQPPAPRPGREAKQAESLPPKDAPPGAGGEVVNLDRFRKK
jgi:hypothetical protein